MILLKEYLLKSTNLEYSLRIQVKKLNYCLVRFVSEFEIPHIP
jgi:hypothetical protein